MFKKIKENLQTFFIIWGIVIVLNQIFIFGFCFAPYCLIAALPHTGLIAGLIIFFMSKSESKETLEGITNSDPIIKRGKPSFPKIDEVKELNNNPYLVNEIEDSELNFIDELKEPYCPNCGSKMILRTARNGRYTGSKFWGCSNFPKCKSIINL